MSQTWTHRDALRLSHVKPLTPAHAEVFNYITGKPIDLEVAPESIVKVFNLGNAHQDTVVEYAANGNLPWEAFSDEQRTPEFWRAMLPNMPIGALVRNLSTMSRVGVLSAANTKEVDVVVAKLTNANAIAKSRIHPVQLTDAMLVYQSGGQASTYASAKSKPYAANKRIVGALEAAIGLAFKAIPDTGKRTLVALDVSGSMSSGRVGGSTLLTPAMGTAIMAVQHAQDINSQFIAFSAPGRNSYSYRSDPNGVTKLDRSELTTVARATGRASQLSRTMTGTDCSLPMLYAFKHGLQIDAFVVYTDNETWAGAIHPQEALRQYRLRSGINARLIVVGMTASSFSIADPSDPGMLDVVGLASDTPQVVVSFIRGDF